MVVSIDGSFLFVLNILTVSVAAFVLIIGRLSALARSAISVSVLHFPRSIVSVHVFSQAGWIPLVGYLCILVGYRSRTVQSIA